MMLEKQIKGLSYSGIWLGEWSETKNPPNKPTLKQRIKNMLKTRNTKRIEELEERIESHFNHNTNVLNERGKQINELRAQAGCGVEHKTDNQVKYVAGKGMFYRRADYFELCETCGKTLKKFDTKLEADEREAEILQENADEARWAVEKAKKEAKENGA